MIVPRGSCSVLAAALVLLVTGEAGARPAESMEAERAAAEAELADLDRRAASLDEQVGLRRRMLRRRLRAMYKMSQGGAIRLIADAATIDELDERLVAARNVVRRDLSELGALGEEMAELSLDRARRDELAHAAPQAESPPTTDLFRRRGDLPRPVPGEIAMSMARVRVREPRAGALAIELPRRGVELATTRGEIVRAVAAGTVRWIGELGAVGRAVLVDHGDRYVTVTDRLASVQVREGARVKSGEPLGTAASTTVAFSLTEGGMPLDPARWLRPPTPAQVAPPPAPIPLGSGASTKAATLAQ